MIDFLTVEDVLQIHILQLERFGGAEGLRDLKLLESATAQAQASFNGDYLHPSLFDMASAYLYHLVLNHPFVDGNKRVALASALIFLELNGVEITQGTQELYNLTIKAAQSNTTKKQIAKELKRLSNLS